GVLEVLHREIELTGLRQDRAELEVRVGELWVELQRGQQLLARLRRLPQLGVRAAVMQVRRGERRSDRERFFQGALRLARRIELQVGEAERAQGLDVT